MRIALAQIVGTADPAVLIVDLDPADVDATRAMLPVLANRRF